MVFTASSSRVSFVSRFKLPWRSEEKPGTSSEAKKPVQYRPWELMKATNNFSNDNEIGRGGFGVVYKVQGMIDGQKVAVKKLFGNTVNEVSDIKKEVSLLSSVTNDNLVMLLGFCSEAGEYILVYEFVANGDIRRFLKDEKKRRTLDWQTRFNIIKGIAKGLCYLHHYSEKKIIHCDLKLENILLDKHNNAKIADFGLSKIVDLSKSHITAVINGTPGYMAPEIWNQMQYSTKSDVYSFGLLILEMVVGCIISQYAKETEETLTHVVWKQWINMKPLEEIIDSCLLDNCPQQEVPRCIHIGLLCVQHYRNKRPSMERVLEMLNSCFDLQKPSSPGFYQGRQADQGPSHEDSADSDELENAMVPKTYHREELEIATNNFSDINKFYEGYMGTIDGRKVYIERYYYQRHELKIISVSSKKKGKRNHKIELLLPNLWHPNVLRLFGYCFEEEGALLFISEYPRRGSLDEYLKHSNDVAAQSKSDLDLGTRLKIIKGLVTGLCYLHYGLQNKIILHSNLNSSNILLDDDWNPKISDYSLMRILDDNYLDDYILGGTIGYMAPELLFCDGKLGDPVKLDVYSLGIIMLEILVGWKSFTYCDRKDHLLQDDVWLHWQNQTLLEMIDPFLATLEEQEEVVRCFQIALLCIECDPFLRPNAQQVVQMLGNTETLPVPINPNVPKSLEYSYNSSDDE
ncbi:hypothetical protein LUZ60_007198 [Juncus effusus]|nr:hypothetical protein LUZ60_007198 [Juncus effusus]